MHGQEKPCKQAISDMLKYQMQQITKCTKELGFKGKEKTEKMNCIMKCVLIASGAVRDFNTNAFHILLNCTE